MTVCQLYNCDYWENTQYLLVTRHRLTNSVSAVSRCFRELSHLKEMNIFGVVLQLLELSQASRVVVAVRRVYLKVLFLVEDTGSYFTRRV